MRVTLLVYAAFSEMTGRTCPDSHMSAYVSIRQHTSAYVGIRQHTSAYAQCPDSSLATNKYILVYVCVCVDIHMYAALLVYEALSY
jgi:hypothetical protein